MMTTRAAIAALVVLNLSAFAVAAEAPAGAMSCSGCHASGTNVQTSVPPLRGRTANDIAEAMAEYKAGKRVGTIMDRIAKGFSDEEIRAIAAWYAAPK